MTTKHRRQETGGNRRAKPAHSRPQAYHQLAGSAVLRARGSGGVPKRAMHDVVHSADDEISDRHLGPGQGAATSFRPDPEMGDAGADLADTLGRSFLDGAVTGDEEAEDAAEEESTDLAEAFEDVPEASSESPLAEEGAPPAAPKRRARPRRHRSP